MATSKKGWLRTSVLSLLGLGLAYSAQSFVNKEEVKAEPVKTTLVNQTWYFHGGATDSRTDATKYQLSPDPEAPCGDANKEVCRISAPNDGTGKPNMSAIVTAGQTVAQRISAAFPSGSTPTTNETVQSLRSVK